VILDVYAFQNGLNFKNFELAGVSQTVSVVLGQAWAKYGPHPNPPDLNDLCGDKNLKNQYFWLVSSLLDSLLKFSNTECHTIQNTYFAQVVKCSADVKFCNDWPKKSLLQCKIVIVLLVFLDDISWSTPSSSSDKRTFVPDVQL